MLASARSAPAAVVLAWSGAAAFALSLLFFLYSYVVRFGVRAGAAPLVPSIAIDIGLFSIFALHHSLLARPSVKDRMRALVPAPLERSVYTWTSSLLFAGVCALWQFVPGELYRLDGAAAWLGYSIQLTGIAITARSSARLDVLDLAGVRQVLATREAPAHVPLETRGLYGVVRHPVYLGWALIVFGTPHMTSTRFVFAAVSTAYLALAIPFEERTLIGVFGEAYRDYRRRVRWRMIPGVY